MEIKGRVVEVLPEQRGTSKTGKSWCKRDFIIETEGQYPKKICIGLFGDKVAKCPNVGADVTVSVDIESREYNGKWFTQVNGWDVKAESAAPTQAPKSATEDERPF